MDTAHRVDRRKLIEEITQALVTAYAPERIVLFGSYAYGTPDQGSDIDLLIIKDTPERFMDRMVTVLRVLSDLHLRVGLDPIVLTPGELTERLRIGDQFVKDAGERGETLYAAT